MEKSINFYLIIINVNEAENSVTCLILHVNDACEFSPLVKKFAFRRQVFLQFLTKKN